MHIDAARPQEPRRLADVIHDLDKSKAISLSVISVAETRAEIMMRLKTTGMLLANSTPSVPFLSKVHPRIATSKIFSAPLPP